MAEIGLMDEAGALYFTDGDKVIVNSRTLQRVMSYAAAFNALIACRPSDPWLTEGAVAASGELATRLGLSGSPAIAERIGLELKDRLPAGLDLELDGPDLAGGETDMRADLLSALLNLGYHRPLAERAVSAALEAGDGTLQQTLRQALKELAR